MKFCVCVLRRIALGQRRLLLLRNDAIQLHQRMPASVVSSRLTLDRSAIGDAEQADGRAYSGKF
jgi:hypothetical protein